MGEEERTRTGPNGEKIHVNDDVDDIYRRPRPEPEPAKETLGAHKKSSPVVEQCKGPLEHQQLKFNFGTL